jgi:hypothetical protein
MIALLRMQIGLSRTAQPNRRKKLPELPEFPEDRIPRCGQPAGWCRAIWLRKRPHIRKSIYSWVAAGFSI